MPTLQLPKAAPDSCAKLTKTVESSRKGVLRGVVVVGGGAAAAAAVVGSRMHIQYTVHSIRATKKRRK